MNTETKRQNRLTTFIKQLKKEYLNSDRQNKLVQTNSQHENKRSLHDDSRPIGKDALAQDNLFNQGTSQEKLKSLKQMSSYENRVKNEFLKRINKQISRIKSSKPAIQDDDQKNNTTIGSQRTQFDSTRIMAQPLLPQEKNDHIKFKQQDLKFFQFKLEESEQNFTDSLYGFYQKSSIHTVTSPYSNKCTQSNQLIRTGSMQNQIYTEEELKIHKYNSVHTEQSQYLIESQRKRDVATQLLDLQKKKDSKINKKDNEEFYSKYADQIDLKYYSKKDYIHTKKKPQQPPQKYTKPNIELNFIREEMKIYKDSKSLSAKLLGRRIKTNLKEALLSGVKTKPDEFLIEKPQGQKQKVVTQPTKLNRIFSAAFYKKKIDEVPGKTDAFDFYQSLHVLNGVKKLHHSLNKMTKLNQRNINKIQQTAENFS